MKKYILSALLLAMSLGFASATSPSSMLNFVAADRDTCENAVLNGSGGVQVAECSIGGGCGELCGALSLSCTSANPTLWGACVDPAKPKVAIPTVTLNNFTPDSIEVGQTSSLSYTSSGATSCIGVGTGPNGTALWNGDLGGTYTPATGVKTSVMNTPGTYTQKVICTGPTGTRTSVTRTLFVTTPGQNIYNPGPVVTLNDFVPDTILVGQTSNFSFSSLYATSCTGAGIWNGDLGGTHTNPQGATTPVMNMPGTYTQKVTCTGPGGSWTPPVKTLVVASPNQAPKPTVTLNEFSPKVISTGQVSGISFTSTGATSCTGSGLVWNGDIGATRKEKMSLAVDSAIYTPANDPRTPVMNTPGTYTQTVTCTGVGGQTTSETRTLVVAKPLAFSTPNIPSKCPWNQAYYEGKEMRGWINASYDGCYEAKKFLCPNGYEAYVWKSPSNLVDFYEASSYYSCTTPLPADKAVVVSVKEGEYTASQTEGTANITIPSTASGKILVLRSQNPVNWIIANPNNVQVKKILVLSSKHLNGVITHEQRLSGNVPNVAIEKPYIEGNLKSKPVLTSNTDALWMSKVNDYDALNVITYLTYRGISIDQSDFYTAGRSSDLPVGIAPSPTLYTPKQAETDAHNAYTDQMKATAAAAMSYMSPGYGFATGGSYELYIYDNKDVSTDPFFKANAFWSAGSGAAPSTKEGAIANCKNDILNAVGKVSQCRWNGEIFASSTNPTALKGFIFGSFSESDGGTVVYSRSSISAVNAKLFCALDKTIRPNLKCTFNGLDVSSYDFAKKIPGFLQVYRELDGRDTLITPNGIGNRYFATFSASLGDKSAENEVIFNYTDLKLGYTESPNPMNGYPERLVNYNFDKTAAAAKKVAYYWNGFYVFSSPANYDPLHMIPATGAGIVSSIPVGKSDPFLVTLTATPRTIRLGDSISLSWNAINSNWCAANGAWNGLYDRTGTVTKTPTTTGEQRYDIACDSANGTVRHSAIVNVIPTTSALPSEVYASNVPVITSLVASPSSFVGNGTTTLSYTSTKTVSCYLKRAGVDIGQTLPTSGTYTARAITSTTEFTLKCRSQDGRDVTKSVTVGVSSPASSAATSTANPVCNSEQYLENGVCKNLTRICPDGRVISAMLSCGTSTVSPVATSSLLVYRQYYGISLQQQRSRVSRVTAVSLCATRIRAIQGRKTNGFVSYNDVTKIRCTWGTEQLYPLNTSYLSGASVVLGTSTVCTDLPYNFHRGAESPSVASLQTFLSSKGFLEGEATGFYGDKTVEAVKAYQTSKGLPSTGMIYDFTRNAIKSESCQ